MTVLTILHYFMLTLSLFCVPFKTSAPGVKRLHTQGRRGLSKFLKLGLIRKNENNRETVEAQIP